MRILSTVAVCLLFALMLTGCNKGTAPVTKPAISEEGKAALDELREFAFQRIDPSVVADHINQVAEKADALRVAHPDVPADETDYILLYTCSSNRQYQRAAEVGERFMSVHTDSAHRPDAIMIVGYSHFSLKEYEKAADLYQFHAGTWPDHAQRDLALNNAGVNLFFAEFYTEAVETLDEMLTMYPNSRYAPGAHQMMALSYYKLDDVQLAAPHIFEYLEASSYLDIANERVVMILDAIEEYAASPKLPDDRLMALSLQALYHSKAYDRTTRSFDVAKSRECIVKLGEELDKAAYAPYTMQAAYAYASLMSRAGKTLDDTLALVDRCIPMCAGNPLEVKFYRLKLMVVANSKELDELLALYNSCPEPVKTLPDVAASVANRLVMNDEYAKALEIAERALAATPGDQGLTRVANMCSLVGKPAPEIAGTEFASGNAIKLSDYRGKVVLIDFWATWCGPCIGELPNVLAVYKKYHDLGFEIFGVSLDQPNKAEQFGAFLKDKGMPWPQIYEGLYWNVPSRKDYKFDGIPFMVLVDRKGIIRLVNKRGEALDPAVESLVNEK